MKRSRLLPLLVAAVLASLHAWHLSSVLPERVASHFNDAGVPNAWMTRDGFVRVYALVIAVVTLVFAGVGALAPRMPDSLINLPNKSYWLAPERRASSLAWITGWATWMGSSTLLFMMAVMRQAELVNLGAQPRIHGAALLLSYLLLTAGMLVALVYRFARKPS